MPAYDYRCRTCDSSFEVRRPIDAGGPVSCPQGHRDTTRVFTAVGIAVGITGGARASAGAAPSAAPAGGCCGGGCCG